jgi:hypothetical protein
MADRKISDLTALTTPASGDFLPIVDISEAAAASKNKKITYSDFLNNIPTGTITSTMILDGTILNADINASAAIVDTKLATIATGGKVSNSATTATNANTASAIVARDGSGNFTAGTITANLTGTASNVTTNANLTGDVTSVGNATSIAAGVIVNADINASAAIVDTKLATIATAGKVSNSATTATDANTASAIVARDASGNFSAGTITAALTGAASSNVLKAGDTMTGALVVPLASAATPSLTFTGDLDSGVFSPGANQVAVATNGTGRLFIDASGDIGINTTPSSLGSSVTTLEVKGGSTTRSGGLRVSSSDSSVKGAFYIYDGAGILGTESATPLDLYTGNSPRLRITSAGLVGVGTSSPGAKLEVVGSDAAPNGVGDFALSYDSSKRLVFGDTGSPTFCSWIQATQTLGAAFWPLALNPSGGNVGIGTTSPASLGTSVTTLEIQGAVTTRSGGIRLSSSDSSQKGAFYIYEGAAVLGTETSHPLGLYVGNTEKARLDSSGRLLVGTGSDSGGALFQVNGDRIRVGTAKTPATSGATGTTGEIAWDADYIYVCTATNTWKRSAIATW